MAKDLECDHMLYPLTMTVNGEVHELTIEASRNLLDVVRNELGLTGAKEGCDDSECGACMMILDGQTVNSCSCLALQANGRAITTVEGLAQGSALNPLQRAIMETGGVQCGYCTPGMLISAQALLERNAQPTDEDIRWALGGNLCRCTGYKKIIQAVRQAADAIAAG
jgi:aerobic-type carbon monoxide dehydrogenase small subunit (CoxS/CutS family)